MHMKRMRMPIRLARSCIQARFIFAVVVFDSVGRPRHFPRREVDSCYISYGRGSYIATECFMKCSKYSMSSITSPFFFLFFSEKL